MAEVTYWWGGGLYVQDHYLGGRTPCGWGGTVAGTHCITRADHLCNGHDCGAVLHFYPLSPPLPLCLGTLNEPNCLSVMAMAVAGCSVTLPSSYVKPALLSC